MPVLATAIRHLWAMPVLAATLAVPAAAQETDPVDALFDALALDDTIAVMREEGLAYAAEVGDNLFGGAPPADWAATTSGIYDAARIESAVRAELAQSIAGQDVTPLIDFFTSEPGASFVALEVAARRALLDDAVDQMARESAAMAMEDATPRYDQVTRFVAANDLVETNVVSAMNSTYSFYLGMMQGGAFDPGMTQQDILSDVWSQEDQIRQNTTEWVYSFLLMAYDPVSDADLETYIAFSESPGGKLLNQAVFGAFDGVFDDISLSLGRAAATYLQSEEL